MRLVGKKGVEIAIGTVIGIILGLVIFGLLFSLSMGFFRRAEELRLEVSEATESELAKIVSIARPVAVWPTSLTLYRGGSATVGVMISNTLPAAQNFSVYAKCDKFLNESGLNECYGTALQAGLKILKFSLHELRPGEKKTVPVALGVAKGAESGTYIVNLEVRRHADGEPFGGITHKIYVRVP